MFYAAIVMLLAAISPTRAQTPSVTVQVIKVEDSKWYTPDPPTRSAGLMRVGNESALRVTPARTYNEAASQWESPW
jgi:hypothetical protein